MLVLIRNKNNSNIIGGGIKITALDTNQSKIKLSMKAPDNVRLWETEVTSFSAING